MLWLHFLGATTRFTWTEEKKIDEIVRRRTRKHELVIVPYVALRIHVGHKDAHMKLVFTWR